MVVEFKTTLYSSRQLISCSHTPPLPKVLSNRWLVRSFEAPRTPTSGSEDDEPAFGQTSARDDSNREAPSAEEPPQKRKPGGYTSRIEQILYENPDRPILITDAGKSLESGGRYIVYTIRTGVWNASLLYHDTFAL